MNDSPVLWYLNRATGVVCLVLFTLVMLLGIAVRLRGRLPGLPRFGTVWLHRDISLTAVAFLAAHIVTAAADSYVSIGLTDALVPFVSGYQPLWTGLGTVAFDLMLAVTVTSLVRVRLGRRIWRAVHWLAYASWPVAVAHGIGIGTDAGAGWALWLTMGCVAAVAVAVGVRVMKGVRDSQEQQPATILAAATARDRVPAVSAPGGSARTPRTGA
ncbi:ferric reductase-like transmembrane domain-containing protein [Actinacidiphila oryziradicis]|jgi:predicted ferric reductase|uniref:Ferric reductase n=1 Tax=Actinacidiphila oryziradicis TaxID=2571141 RepID=A0A4U0S736_9ACTN|nr:ferric reductase-like transmembrane domain-containing protein [Actinacidiphila oryziradicis]TKA04946.1 ferric reductase [Actinacidiphila oryziradicis]